MHEHVDYAIDRVLLASFQPNKVRAARVLAGGLVHALAALETRDGVVIVQLDEFVLGEDSVVASVPFLPAQPVALCLTGTPKLVAAVRASIQKSTMAHFAFVRPSSHLKGLRVVAFVRDETVTLDVSRDFGAKGPRVLASKGWTVLEASGDFESDADQTLLEAEAMLGDLAARDLKPHMGITDPKRRKARQDGSSILTNSGTKRSAAVPGDPVTKRKPACPKCGGKKVLRIKYGYPTPEAEAAAGAGKFVLGGCCVSPDQREWYCTVCEHEWAVKREFLQEDQPTRAPVPTRRLPQSKVKTLISRFITRKESARKSVTGAFVNPRRAVAIEAIGNLVPLEDRDPTQKRLRLDEDWLKKLHVKRRARKKATRKR